MAKMCDSSKCHIIENGRFYKPGTLVDLCPAKAELTPFESLLDAMPDFIYYYDQDLKVLWANRAALLDHGLHRHEMIGRHFFEVSCKLPEPCENCPVIVGLDSNQSEVIENKPHTGRLFYTRTYPVSQNGPEITGRLFVAQDISNLKNRYSVIEILNQINELFHTDDSLSSICQKLSRDIATNFGYAYAAITMHSSHPEEIIAMGATDLLGKFPFFRRLLASKSFTGQVFKDGEILNITGLGKLDKFNGYHLKDRGAETVLAVPLKIEDKIIGAIVLADVIHRMETELIIERLCTVANRLAAEINRKQAEDRLREERNFTTAILNNAGPLIMVMDWQGRIIRFNKTCERLSGHVHQEAIGRHVWEVGLAADGGDTMRNLFPFDRNSMLPKSFENSLVTKTGEKRLISWSNTLMADEVNNRLHIVSIGVDITERKAAEEEAEIRRRQLMEADKMVSLGLLSSEVAHEINNPNNFIALNTPILKMAWKDIAVILDKYRETCGDFLVANVPYSEMVGEIPALFNGIESGSQRIREIVENMKRYARRDEPTKMQSVNMNEVIQAALMLLATQIRKHTSGVSTRLLDKLPSVSGNFQRLEQVVVNLIQNACLAISGNGGRIFIETTYNQESKHVLVSLSDEGVGIPQEHLYRIFDPFFTTKAHIGGTGLGLSVCAAIVKEHNGELIFDSTVGQGTRVNLSLPGEKEFTHVQTE